MALEKLRKWHRELSPRFEGAAGKALRRVLSVEHWLDRINSTQAALKRAAKESEKAASGS
eukprot:CAMPEP_0172607506 /NCGR_PEP_ID=MMETSP1068-20121228/27674_1 /TAXON_ID=35684 /ORGANISM="Pseudopedinella elastica, Strain CCMP716" /LENGTH=59 /DNA_ID=CAMNT_0013410533 /DNA_START=365 /DNA_END=543 /DNA_ORIENTATION=+